MFLALICFISIHSAVYHQQSEVFSVPLFPHPSLWIYCKSISKVETRLYRSPFNTPLWLTQHRDALINVLLTYLCS